MIYFTKSGEVSNSICAGYRSSIELYKKCVDNNHGIFIFNSTLLQQSMNQSSDIFYFLDEYYIAHFVKPKDGLIKFNRTKTFGIALDSNFEYLLEFHDRNLNMPTTNPDIVPKNMLMIKKNVYAFIYLKVNSFISVSNES